MIHKLRKNKRRSFSAATNLKTQPLEKQRSYQVKYAVFLQFKEQDAAFSQLSYIKCRFYADLKKSAAFLKIRRKAAKKPAFTQSCILFSQGWPLCCCFFTPIISLGCLNPDKDVLNHLFRLQGRLVCYLLLHVIRESMKKGSHSD